MKDRFVYLHQILLICITFQIRFSVIIMVYDNPLKWNVNSRWCSVLDFCKEKSTARGILKRPVLFTTLSWFRRIIFYFLMCKIKIKIIVFTKIKWELTQLTLVCYWKNHIHFRYEYIPNHRRFETFLNTHEHSYSMSHITMSDGDLKSY